MPRHPQHGGRRAGAGRKPGSGAYGEPTQVLRIPQSRIPAVRDYLAQCRRHDAATLRAANDELLLPLIGRVAAGQPIDADAHVEREVAVDRQLFRPRPHYLLRVQGHSMRDAGILDRDLLAVHRTPDARNGQIVIARLDGEITVKRLSRQRNRIVLLPENADFEPIPVHADDFAIEGICVGVIRVP